VDIDLDKKTADVTFVSYQTNLDVIETAITEAGYDANAKKRNMEAYESLPACCKKE
jgi:periplasmic mercuric ion binding protein